MKTFYHTTALRSVISFFLLLGSFLSANGQLDPESQHSVDSINRLIKKAGNPIEKGDLMVERAIIYYKRNEEEGIKAAKEALAAYPEKEWLARAKASKVIAKMYGDLDKLQSKKYFVEAAKGFGKVKGQDSLVAYMYMCAGRSMYSLAKYDDAMTYYMKAKNIYDQHQIYDVHHGELYHYIGSVYKRQKDMDMACDWYTQELEYSKTHNMMDVRAEATYLLASCAETNEEAIALDEEALALFEQMDNRKMAALLYGNLGASYMSLKNYNKAEKYVTQALKVFEDRGDLSSVVHLLCNLAEIHVQLKKLDDADKELQRAEKLVKQVEEKRYLRLASINKNRYYLEEARGNYKDALAYYQTYIDYKDSSIQADYKDDVMEMGVKYNTAQNELKISKQEAQIARQDVEKQEELFWNRILVGGVVIALLFGIFIFNRYKVSNRQKKIIEAQKLEVEKKNKEIMDSIVYAKRIQAAILPPKKIIREYLHNSFIVYMPKDIVAGDFYWMEHRDEITLFAAADCTGHGVPGAMVSVVCNNGLNRAVREHGLTDPGQILDKTREIVVSEFEKSEENVQDGMDIALCALKGRTLSYAGAHNPLWIIRKGEEFVEEIKAQKQPIGKSDNPIRYKTHTVQLGEGDSFYIFSDGFTDQFGGEHGKKYMATHFKNFLISIRNEDLQHQKELIEEEFTKWKGSLEQLDDVCVIGVRV